MQTATEKNFCPIGNVKEQRFLDKQSTKFQKFTMNVLKNYNQ